ncbi:GtrA family protein [Mesorhizobium sp. M0983]|uniref:GtrA family protein n=1 Tax=unclassified Mesorhizobium TaxID=325217 RepID=UPI00333DF018
MLARFGSVGIAATILYAVMAAALVKWQRFGLSPVGASLAAYTAAALFSYLAHKFVTFASSGSHDAVLLNAAKARSVFQETGFRDIRSEHFLLLPSARPLARRVERVFAPLPLGAQYACSARV